MTAEYALQISHAATLGYIFLTGIHSVQKWLNLFDMTRGDVEGGAETSITDEASTAVVMTIAMAESKDPLLPLSGDLLTFSVTQTQTVDITAMAAGPTVPSPWCLV